MSVTAAELPGPIGLCCPKMTQATDLKPAVISPRSNDAVNSGPKNDAFVAGESGPVSLSKSMLVRGVDTSGGIWCLKVGG